MPQTHNFTIDSGSIGRRLDQVVTEIVDDISRTEAQRMISLKIDIAGGVHVNSRREKPGYRVREGDVISILQPELIASRIEAEDIPLDIVFEDEDILVINKARGMVVHPAPGSPHGTLVNAVLAHADDLSGIGGEERPGIVHRLDKDTGGLMMIAKNDRSHRSLQEQIQQRTAERRYLAIVWGSPKFETATIDAPIGRHPVDRKRMAVVTDPKYTSRSAVTELTVLERFAGVFSLVEAKLQTGRTHQIRVHCTYIHHPVVGDPLYAGIRKVPSNEFTARQLAGLEQALSDLIGQALHAYSLAFNHPTSGERLKFQTALPTPFQSLLDQLHAACRSSSLRNPGVSLNEF